MRVRGVTTALNRLLPHLSAFPYTLLTNQKPSADSTASTYGILEICKHSVREPIATVNLQSSQDLMVTFSSLRSRKLANLLTVMAVVVAAHVPVKRIVAQSAPKVKINFTESTLPNGLHVIYAEDHT